jgi:hypothetical protein
VQAALEKLLIFQEHPLITVAVAVAVAMEVEHIPATLVLVELVAVVAVLDGLRRKLLELFKLLVELQAQVVVVVEPVLHTPTQEASIHKVVRVDQELL